MLAIGPPALFPCLTLQFCRCLSPSVGNGLDRSETCKQYPSREIYPNALERSRPFPTNHFIVGCQTLKLSVGRGHPTTPLPSAVPHLKIHNVPCPIRRAGCPHPAVHLNSASISKIPQRTITKTSLQQTHNKSFRFCLPLCPRLFTPATPRGLSRALKTLHRSVFARRTGGGPELFSSPDGAPDCAFLKNCNKKTPYTFV